MDRAWSRWRHEPEGTQITLALSCGEAGHIFGMEVLGIDAEQHSTNRHPGALVIALREGVDRDRLRIDSVKVVFACFFGQAFGHALEQAVAAVSREDHGLAPFGNLHPRSPLKGDMADHLALTIPRDDRNEFATLDLVPVTVRREHLRMHIGVTVDREKAAG